MFWLVYLSALFVSCRLDCLHYYTNMLRSSCIAYLIKNDRECVQVDVIMAFSPNMSEVRGCAIALTPKTHTFLVILPVPYLV
jgi:hypothetical protein